MAAGTGDACSVAHNRFGDCRMINNKQRRLLAGLLSLALFMSACGGSIGSEVSAASADSSQESTGEGDPAAASDDITRFEGHEGQILVSAFIPELADLPVPDMVAFHAGVAYDAGQDPRETAIQRVDFLLEPAEVAAFYFEQLAAQGYSVANGSNPDSAAGIAEYTENSVESFRLSFDGPDGVPINLSIDPANTGGNTTMNINRFRSGTR